MSDGYYEKIQESAAFIRGRIKVAPKVGAILGSGLGAFAQNLQNAVTIPYAEIPNFPLGYVAGHAGTLVIGTSRGTPCAVLSGRAHLYEGYTARDAVFPVRTLAALGVKALVVTNAAGGISTPLNPGDMMLIEDHINLLGDNPLIGPNDERLGPRFPDMTDAYSPRLQAVARATARELQLRLRFGVYAAVRGPTYETPAEIRMLAAIGADAVGMSTAHEVIAARHLGLEVLGISVITNLAAGLAGKKLSHEEVMEMGERTKEDISRLLTHLLPKLAQEP